MNKLLEKLRADLELLNTATLSCDSFVECHDKLIWKCVPCETRHAVQATTRALIVAISALSKVATEQDAIYNGEDVDCRNALAEIQKEILGEGG